MFAIARKFSTKWFEKYPATGALKKINDLTPLARVGFFVYSPYRLYSLFRVYLTKRRSLFLILKAI
jgi:hypothetical protein